MICISSISQTFVLKKGESGLQRKNGRHNFQSSKKSGHMNPPIDKRIGFRSIVVQFATEMNVESHNIFSVVLSCDAISWIQNFSDFN